MVSHYHCIVFTALKCVIFKYFFLNDWVKKKKTFFPLNTIHFVFEQHTE